MKLSDKLCYLSRTINSNDLIMCIAYRVGSKTNPLLEWTARLTGTRNEEHRGSILDSAMLWVIEGETRTFGFRQWMK